MLGMSCRCLGLLRPRKTKNKGIDASEFFYSRDLSCKREDLAAWSFTQRSFIVWSNHTCHQMLSSNVSGCGNSTSRRELGRKYTGPCRAYNSIDKCWRCDRHWAGRRKRLADCAQGFGHETIGGKNGEIYVVTDPSDNDMVNPKPGTLRHAVIQKQPLWIIFQRSMFIRLKEELIMYSDKTIDGRGANIQITGGAGIMIQFVSNIIIHNIHFHDIVPGNGGMIRSSVDHYGYRGRSDGDAISIFGSNNIWIDHCSFSKSADGLIDVVAASTDVTISNCHFIRHEKALLFGASDVSSEDKVMRVTVAYNHFGKFLSQRLPAVRWGFVQVVNNDYTHWESYAIGGADAATIISQGNRFIAINGAAKEVTYRKQVPESVWKDWTWRSEGDLMINGAKFVQSGDPNWAQKYRGWPLIKAEPATEVPKLTLFAGATLSCQVGKPC